MSLATQELPAPQTEGGTGDQECLIKLLGAGAEHWSHAELQRALSHVAFAEITDDMRVRCELLCKKSPVASILRGTFTPDMEIGDEVETQYLSPELCADGNDAGLDDSSQVA